LRERLRDTVTAHFAPAVALLCAELGCKERALWLFVADGLAGTLAWTQIEQEAPVERAAVEAELDGLVRVPTSPLFAKQIGLFELTFREQPRLQYDRATCCYWYKTEDANGDCCTTCPRRPPAERDALLLKYLEEEEAAKATAIEEGVPA
jgi:ferric iron reductase protein FhuF